MQEEWPQGAKRKAEKPPRKRHSKPGQGDRDREISSEISEAANANLAHSSAFGPEPQLSQSEEFSSQIHRFLSVSWRVPDHNPRKLYMRALPALCCLGYSLAS